METKRILRWTLRTLVSAGAFLLLTAARNESTGGGCGTIGGRSLVWTRGDAVSTTYNLADTSTSTILASTVSQAPLASAIWTADHHSRLVMFEWELSSAYRNDAPWPRRAPSGTPPPPPRLWGQVAEVPWLDDAGFTPQSLVAAFPTLSVRNVDLGSCSVRMPWVVDDDTDIPTSAAFAGIDGPGDGVAEQLASGIAGAVMESLNERGRKVQSGFIIRWNLTSSIRDEASYRVSYERDGTSEFCTRIRLKAIGEASYYTLPLGPAGTLPCGFDIDFDLCGRFSSENSRLKFTVTRNEGFVDSSPGVICGGIGDGIASELSDAQECDDAKCTRGQIASEVADAFTDQLTYFDLTDFNSTFRISGCKSATAGRTCESNAVLTEMEPECLFIEQTGTTLSGRPIYEVLSAADQARLNLLPEADARRQMSSCVWQVPVERVELMPSSLMLVLSDNETDRFDRFVQSNGLIAAEVADICFDVGGEVFSHDTYRATLTSAGNDFSIDDEDEE